MHAENEPSPRYRRGTILFQSMGDREIAHWLVGVASKWARLTAFGFGKGLVETAVGGGKYFPEAALLRQVRALDPQWSNAPAWLAQGGDDAARVLDSAALSRLGKTVADLGRIHRATGSLAGTLDLLRHVGRRRTVRSQGPAPGVGADGDAVVHGGGEERLESVLGLTTNPTTTTQMLPLQHRSAGCFTYPSRLDHAA